MCLLCLHSCHGKAEECISLCRALLGVVVWLMQGCAWYCEKLRELGLSASTEASLRACQERLHTLLSSTKNRALVHIARLEEQGVLHFAWNVPKACWVKRFLSFVDDQDSYTLPEEQIRATQKLHEFVKAFEVFKHFSCSSFTGSWSNVEQLIVKVTEGLSSVPNLTLRTNLEESLSLLKG